MGAYCDDSTWIALCLVTAEPQNRHPGRSCAARLPLEYLYLARCRRSLSRTKKNKDARVSDIAIQQGGSARFCIWIESVTNRGIRVILGGRTGIKWRQENFPGRKVFRAKIVHPEIRRREQCTVVVVHVHLRRDSDLAKVVHV